MSWEGSEENTRNLIEIQVRRAHQGHETCQYKGCEGNAVAMYKVGPLDFPGVRIFLCKEHDNEDDAYATHEYLEREFL